MLAERVQVSPFHIKHTAKRMRGKVCNTRYVRAASLL